MAAHRKILRQIAGPTKASAVFSHEPQVIEGMSITQMPHAPLRTATTRTTRNERKPDQVFLRGREPGRGRRARGRPEASIPPWSVASAVCASLTSLRTVDSSTSVACWCCFASSKARSAALRASIAASTFARATADACSALTRASRSASSAFRSSSISFSRRGIASRRSRGMNKVRAYALQSIKRLPC